MISPPIEKKMIYEVVGQELLITSRSVLDSNTTYTLTIASGIKDLVETPSLSLLSSTFFPRDLTSILFLF
jgi:hypothetical protein